MYIPGVFLTSDKSRGFFNKPLESFWFFIMEIRLISASFKALLKLTRNKGLKSKRVVWRVCVLCAPHQQQFIKLQLDIRKNPKRRSIFLFLCHDSCTTHLWNSFMLQCFSLAFCTGMGWDRADRDSVSLIKRTEIPWMT